MMCMVFCFRYMSRCLLMEFQDPPLNIRTSQHMKLVDTWKKCGACIGFCIGLGEKFLPLELHRWSNLQRCLSLMLTVTLAHVFFHLMLLFSGLPRRCMHGFPPNLYKIVVLFSL